MITTCSLYVHYMFTVCSGSNALFSGNLPVALILVDMIKLHIYIHYIFTIYSLYIQCMITTCSLYVHYIFTIYLLYFYYIFTTGGNALFSGNLPVALILVGMIKLHDNTTMSTVGINDMLIYS